MAKLKLRIDDTSFQKKAPLQVLEKAKKDYKHLETKKTAHKKSLEKLEALKPLK